MIRHALYPREPSKVTSKAPTRVLLRGFDIALVWMFLCTPLFAWETAIAEANDVSRFAQLEQTLPTPNVYRNAAGAPGHKYWQQQADYKIDARLDETKRRVRASQTITYTNRSPDTLPYLWLQLDQNRFRRDSLEERSRTGRKGDDGVSDSLSFSRLRAYQSKKDIDYGFEITSLTDGSGRALRTTVVDTMLRVDLPEPLGPDSQQVLRIDWQFAIADEDALGARGGYEHFEDSDTYIYFLAQWFPRMAAYTDYVAWQHHQFLGRGEFTLEFGDYEVALTVPADHIVSATGELVNERDVLSATQLKPTGAQRRPADVCGHSQRGQRQRGQQVRSTAHLALQGH